MRVLRTAILLLAPVWLSGCRLQPGDGVSPDLLRQVPVEVSMGGRTLFLESYLWRDFMPVSPPDGRPLAAVLRVHATTGGVPAGITADSAWIIRRDEVWASAPRRQQEPDSAGDIEFVSRDGPLWPPDDIVDVVLRLRLSGQTVLVRAANQRIRRTD